MRERSFALAGVLETTARASSLWGKSLGQERKAFHVRLLKVETVRPRKGMGLRTGARPCTGVPGPRADTLSGLS